MYSPELHFQKESPVPSVVSQNCAEIILVYVLNSCTFKVLEYRFFFFFFNNSAALNTNVHVGIEMSFKSYTIVEQDLLTIYGITQGKL